MNERRGFSGPKEPASGQDGAADHSEVSPPGYCENVLASASKGRTQRRKTSQYISKHQAMNLIAALEFANVMGFPLNVSLDISWVFFSGSVDDRTRFARCKERLSKWAKRHRFPLTMIWTREVGINGGVHTHVLLYVPPWFMDNGDFERALKHAFEPEGGGTHPKAIKIQPAHFPEGKLRYNLKGIDPKHARELGMHASDQGVLQGKRAGCTENVAVFRSKFARKLM
jgi:hypothetical protein